jgi:hypothetical protein
MEGPFNLFKESGMIELEKDISDKTTDNVFVNPNKMQPTKLKKLAEEIRNEKKVVSSKPLKSLKKGFVDNVFKKKRIQKKVLAKHIDDVYKLQDVSVSDDYKTFINKKYQQHLKNGIVQGITSIENMFELSTIKGSKDIILNKKDVYKEKDIQKVANDVFKDLQKKDIDEDTFKASIKKASEMADDVYKTAESQKIYLNNKREIVLTAVKIILAVGGVISIYASFITVVGLIIKGLSDMKKK